MMRSNLLGLMVLCLVASLGFTQPVAKVPPATVDAVYLDECESYAFYSELSKKYHVQVYAPFTVVDGATFYVYIYDAVNDEWYTNTADGITVEGNKTGRLDVLYTVKPGSDLENTCKKRGPITVKIRMVPTKGKVLVINGFVFFLQI